MADADDDADDEEFRIEADFEEVKDDEVDMERR